MLAVLVVVGVVVWMGGWCGSDHTLMVLAVLLVVVLVVVVVGGG